MAYLVSKSFRQASRQSARKGRGEGGGESGERRRWHEIADIVRAAVHACINFPPIIRRHASDAPDSVSCHRQVSNDGRGSLRDAGKVASPNAAGAVQDEHHVHRRELDLAPIPVHGVEQHLSRVRPWSSRLKVHVGRLNVNTGGGSGRGGRRRRCFRSPAAGGRGFGGDKLQTKNALLQCLRKQFAPTPNCEQ